MATTTSNGSTIDTTTGNNNQNNDDSGLEQHIKTTTPSLLPSSSCSTKITTTPAPADDSASFHMVDGLFRFMNEDDDDDDVVNGINSNLIDGQNDLNELNPNQTSVTNGNDDDLTTIIDDNNNATSSSVTSNNIQQQTQVNTTIDYDESTTTNNNNHPHLTNNTTNNNQSSDERIEKRQSLDYLKELFQDRERISMMPYGIFFHLNRLLDQEILRVRASLIHIDGSADQRKHLTLPEPDGPVVQQSRRISIPVDKYPEHNFVGRIIGPRGLTIRELEVDCGCKLYIRGKGSLRNKDKEEKCRGLPNWEHLNEELHVLIIVEDTEQRAEIKLNYAVEQINKLIDSVISQKDDFKMRQLAELAILNDKFNTKINNNVNSMVNNGLNKNRALSSASLSPQPATIIDTTTPTVMAAAAAAHQSSSTSPTLASAAISPHQISFGHHHHHHNQATAFNAASQYAAAAFAANAGFPAALANQLDAQQQLFLNPHLTAAAAAAAAASAQHQQHQQQQQQKYPIMTDFFAASQAAAMAAAASGLHLIPGVGAFTGGGIIGTSASHAQQQQQQQQQQQRFHPYSKKK